MHVQISNWKSNELWHFYIYPWRRHWLPTQVFLPGEFHGRSGLAGYIVHGVAQSQTRLRAPVTFTFIFTLCSSKTQPSPVSWQPWYMVLGAVMTSLHSLHPWHCNHLPILSNQIQILLLLAIVDSSVQFSSVAQLCLTFCKCVDCSPPGSSVQRYSR